MPLRTATTYVTVAFLLFLGMGKSFAEPCPDTTDPVPIAVQNSAARINGTLNLESGVAYLEVLVELINPALPAYPCSTPLSAQGVADGNVMINTPQVSMVGPCEGPWNLTVDGVCGLGNDDAEFTIPPPSTGGDPTPEPTPPGPTPTPGPGGSPTPGGTPTGNDLQISYRSGLGTNRPTARLIDIDVEVNPTFVNLDDFSAHRREQGAAIDDVTFTARLVFSGGEIPKNFKHRVSGWEFWPAADELTANQSGDGGKWSDAMEGKAKLKLRGVWTPGLTLDEDATEEERNEHNKMDVNVAFTVLPDSRLMRSTGGRVVTQKIPLKVVYRESAEEDSRVFSKVVNIQVERKPVSGPTGSSGPASRIVTFSRMIE